jgi:hypothetical protein
MPPSRIWPYFSVVAFGPAILLGLYHGLLLWFCWFWQHEPSLYTIIYLLYSYKQWLSSSCHPVPSKPWSRDSQQ